MALAQHNQELLFSVLMSPMPWENASLPLLLNATEEKVTESMSARVVGRGQCNCKTADSRDAHCSVV